MEKIRLNIVGLSYSQTHTGSCALVLGEVNGQRHLPIVIGGFEAQAISIEIEKMTPTRPLTHDLFKTFAECYGISLQEVLIYNLAGSIFYAKLICFDGKKTTEIDARTSDAVALAVRFECPIYTYEFILATAGTLTQGTESTHLENLTTEIQSTLLQPATANLSKLSTEELQKNLEKALTQEAYEKAATIRDELDRRKFS
jgi:bifunctional DNase/RNase